MTPRKTLCLGLALLLGLFLTSAVPFASAEPEENDVSAKVKEQMRKIIELMRKNEQALLELSTGGKARTAAVDVEVDPPEGESPEGQPAAEGGRESPAAGSEAARNLEEIMKAQRGTSEQIPGELEELVRMVPT